MSEASPASCPEARGRWSKGSAADGPERVESEQRQVGRKAREEGSQDHGAKGENIKKGDQMPLRKQRR